MSKIIPYGVLIHKNYTAGYTIFIDKGLHLKITETACMSMLALKINYYEGSAFSHFLQKFYLTAAKFYAV